jgi:hypothetical protein
MPLFDGDGSKREEGLDYVGEHGESGEFLEEDPAAMFIKGPKQLSKEKLMMEAESVLRASGWTAQAEKAAAPYTRFVPEQQLTANQWKARISGIREELFTSKFRNAPDTDRPKRPSDEPAIGFDVKLLKASYFTKQFKAANKMAQRQINTIASTFNLNAEQDRAFRLVANHATDLAAPPLRMYLGGVGGTGKSQVIKALVEFFEVRSESHRFIVLGPTGTAAALLNGSTYHSVLGLRDSNDNDSERISGARIKKVQERIRGVEYIFLDEVSMVSCSALYSISARLAHSLGEPNEPFGGLNGIFAGDFAQLPPVSAKALYSPESSVAPLLQSKMSILDQKNMIGKIIWQQITTVVLLKQNMRQTANTPDDEKFRTALTNI